MCVWFLLVVVVGLLPILMQIIRAVNRGTPLDLPQLLGRGDLLVLTTAIAGSCVYALLTSYVDMTRRLLLVTSFILLAMISCLWYGDLVNAMAPQAGSSTTSMAAEQLFSQQQASRNVATWSAAMLGLTAALGAKAELACYKAR